MVLEMLTAPEPWPVLTADLELGQATPGPPDPAAKAARANA